VRLHRILSTGENLQRQSISPEEGSRMMARISKTLVSVRVARTRLRPIAVAAAALVTALMFTVAAHAVTPHFVSSSAAVDSNGALTVSFKEAGLGSGTISYLVDADASAVYACINRGENPAAPAHSAKKRQAVSESVTQLGSFSVDKNGQITESLTLP